MRNIQQIRDEYDALLQDSPTYEPVNWLTPETGLLLSEIDRCRKALEGISEWAVHFDETTVVQITKKALDNA